MLPPVFRVGDDAGFQPLSRTRKTPVALQQVQPTAAELLYLIEKQRFLVLIIISERLSTRYGTVRSAPAGQSLTVGTRLHVQYITPQRPQHPTISTRAEVPNYIFLLRLISIMCDCCTVMFRLNRWLKHVLAASVILMRSKYYQDIIWLVTDF